MGAQVGQVESKPRSPERAAQSSTARLQAPPDSSNTAGDTRKALIQAWWGDDVLKMCHSADLAEAYQRWVVLARKGLPRLTDLYDAEPNKGSSKTLLLMRVGDDFLHVHQSPGLIADMGRDVRGKLLSELQGGIAQDLQPHFAAATDKRA